MKKSVKAVSLIIAILMLALIALPVNAGEEATVYVTIANGDLMISYESVTVTDADNDGELTINDALFCAHESFYEGGAAAGYSSENNPDWGLSLTKLWGVENGGSYMYYVNNKSAYGLADKVSDSDHIYAFVLVSADWNNLDKYTFFGNTSETVKAGDELELTLLGAGFDATTFEQVNTPVKDAKIYVDGKDSGVKTDENGKATIILSDAGKHFVSAKSESEIIAPPVLNVTVGSSASGNPQTGDGAVVLTALLLVSSLAFAAAVIGRRKIED